MLQVPSQPPHLPIHYITVFNMSNMYISSDYLDALDRIIETYDRITETLPRINQLGETFKDSPILLRRHFGVPPAGV